MSDATGAAGERASFVPGASLVRAENLALRYGAHSVLEGVDLEVRAGEFWFVLGPNGAGKSTLLRAILGLMQPVSGALRIDPALDRTRIGFVPQRCDLNPSVPTTIREFVSLGLVGTGAGRRERRERGAAALAIVGLAGMDRRDYWALSGGERQRALVARALVRWPRLLVLDEPTAGLDPPAEERLMELVARLNADEGLTILFVTHDVELPERFGTHVALVQGGRVVAGERSEILAGEGARHVYARMRSRDDAQHGPSGSSDAGGRRS